jgi:hypothetical protein
MRHPKKPFAFGPLTGVIYVCVLSATLSPLQSTQAPSTAANILTATVAAVDTKARMLEAISGVGHALQVVRMQVQPACKITVAGAPGQLGDLRRGSIVRIHYHKTAEGNMADNIETIRLTPTGENR